MLCPLCQSDNPSQTPRCRACGAPLQTRSDQNGATPDALASGVLLAGTYAVEEVLGQGGFGITYRCHDRMLDRPVAVKEFFPSGCRRHNAEVQASRGLTGADFREARAQFLSEARVLARCHHAGIVGVHAAFEANETAYMVMELLHGKSLAQLLSARGGSMNQAEAVGIIERVGEALQFVHEQNLLHRDIKPDNIIVCDDGRVMLIDFGTARETVQGQVQGQTVVVTPGYAPLEQYARQARRGAFTDVYSLAATLYHLLTGQMPPAASDRAMGVILRPIRETNSQIGASVARATESALQMEIAKRPQSVREFLDLLHAPVEDAEVEAYFSPHPSDFARDGNGEIPSALAPDALRARQQLWQNVIPSANAQPVQLAPPSAFSGAANPPAATTIAHLNAGGVKVQNSGKSGNGAWWGFAAFVGFIGFLVLLGMSGSQRTATPPPAVWSSDRSRYSPPFVPAANQDNLKRLEAQRAWDALPVLQPMSIQILPESKKNGAPKNTAWRGAVEFSPNGKRLAYVDNQAILRVLSLPNRRVLHSLALDKTRTSVDAMFSPDNQTIAVAQTGDAKTAELNGFTGRVDVWNLRNEKRFGAFAIGAPDYYVWPQAILNEGQLLLRTGKVGETGRAQLFLWNPKTGKRGKSPISVSDTADWGYGVAAPNGKQFVVGNTLGRLRWLDFGAGKLQHEQFTKLTQGERQRLFGGDYTGSVNASLGVRGIDYSLDGSYVASRNDGEIRVFDSKAKEVGSLSIGNKGGMFFSISPDGKWLAAQGNLPYSPDGNLLWNVKTGQKIRLASPSDILLDYSFSPDGKQLYGIFSAGDPQFQMVTWDLNAKPPAMFGNASEINLQSSSVNPAPHTPSAQTETLLAIATDSAIEIAPKTGRFFKTLPLERRDVAELGLSPDGRFLAARKSDGAVQLWDVQAQKSVFQSEVASSASQQNADAVVSSENLHALAFSSDNRLWAYARPDGASTVVELRTLEATPRLLASFPQKESVTTLSFSPDNKGLICSGDKGLLQWFDVATRKLRDSVATGETIFDVAFGARNLVIMGKETTQVYQVAANSKNPLQSAAQFKLPSAFDSSRDAYTESAISPDGKLLALAQDQGSVQIWDLATKTKLQNLSRDFEDVTLIYGLKFSADSHQLSAFGQKLRERRIVVKTWTRPKSP